jgi:hypothetical protein
MFNFDANKAKKADGGNHITESGYYASLTIKECIISTGTESTQFCEFNFEDDMGRQLNFVSVLIRQKDGKEAYGMAKIHALMGLLRLQNVSSVPVTVDKFGRQVTVERIPAIIGKQVGVIVQRENKPEGRFSMNVLHFVGYDGRTYAEMADDKPALAVTRKVEDKGAPTQKSQGSFGSSYAPPLDDSDLPF